MWLLETHRPGTMRIHDGQYMRCAHDANPLCNPAQLDMLSQSLFQQNRSLTRDPSFRTASTTLMDSVNALPRGAVATPDASPLATDEAGRLIDLHRLPPLGRNVMDYPLQRTDSSHSQGSGTSECAGPHPLLKGGSLAALMRIPFGEFPPQGVVL